MKAVSKGSFLAKTDDFRRFSHLPYLDYSAQIKTARIV